MIPESEDPRVAAALRWCRDYFDSIDMTALRLAFLAGADWQSQRIVEGPETREAFNVTLDRYLTGETRRDEFEEWFVRQLAKERDAVLTDFLEGQSSSAKSGATTCISPAADPPGPSSGVSTSSEAESLLREFYDAFCACRQDEGDLLDRVDAFLDRAGSFQYTKPRGGMR